MSAFHKSALLLALFNSCPLPEERLEIKWALGLNAPFILQLAQLRHIGRSCASSKSVTKIHPEPSSPGHSSDIVIPKHLCLGVLWRYAMPQPGDLEMRSAQYEGKKQTRSREAFVSHPLLLWGKHAEMQGECIQSIYWPGKLHKSCLPVGEVEPLGLFQKWG